MIQVQLMDVCDFQGGSQPPKEEWLDFPADGYIRMLQIRDFTQQESTKPEYVKASSRLKYCDEDDVLVARYGASIGKILRGLAGAYNVAIMKTVPIVEKLDKDYLYYFLVSSSFQNFITKVGSRAAQAGFNKEDLKEVMLPLPPIETQRKIAAVLDKAQEMIDLRKAQLEKLDEFLRSVFLDMFGDPVMERVSRWPRRNVNEICKIVSGGTPSKDISAYWVGTIPWVSPKDMKTKLLIDSIDHISAQAVKNTNLKILPEKTILIVVRGMILARNLPIALTQSPATINQDMKGLIIKNNQVEPIYLLHAMLNSERQLMTMISNSAHGTKRVETDDIGNFGVFLPPLPLQTQFAAIVEATEAQKALMQQSLTEMENNFNSLMQRAFRGDLF